MYEYVKVCFPTGETAETIETEAGYIYVDSNNHLVGVNMCQVVLFDQFRDLINRHRIVLDACDKTYYDSIEEIDVIKDNCIVFKLS